MTKSSIVYYIVDSWIAIILPSSSFILHPTCLHSPDTFTPLDFLQFSSHHSSHFNVFFPNLFLRSSHPWVRHQMRLQWKKSGAEHHRQDSGDHVDPQDPMNCWVASSRNLAARRNPLDLNSFNETNLSFEGLIDQWIYWFIDIPNGKRFIIFGRAEVLFKLQGNQGHIIRLNNILYLYLAAFSAHKAIVVSVQWWYLHNPLTKKGFMLTLASDFAMENFPTPFVHCNMVWKKRLVNHTIFIPLHVERNLGNMSQSAWSSR